MDIEGFVRKRIDDYTYEDLTALLASRIREYKDLSEENSCKMAEAVIDEVKTTLELNSLDAVSYTHLTLPTTERV